MTSGYDAVVLLGFGGPEGVDDVVPFLERVTAGRGIPTERLVEVGQHYFALGGVSPINAQNRALRDALAQALTQRRSDPVAVHLAHRNSAPFVAEVLSSLAADGAERVLTVATAAYAGYSACRQYREDVGTAVAECGGKLTARKLAPYWQMPSFTETIARLLLAALPGDLSLAAPSTRLVFTTHSIPTTMASASGPAGDAYLDQHRWVAARVAELIAEATGVHKPWDLVFQSRSGPPQVPWLEPDVNDALVALAAGGTTDVILVPIGFISDHMEVIWDLDTQARQTAEGLGIRLIRTPTVGTDPAFVHGLAELISAELDRGPSTAAGEEPCYGRCCANPRSTAPAIPGTGSQKEPA